MTNEKNRIEALLFTVAKRIHLDEISKITGLRNMDKIKAALNELKIDYETRGSSMILQDEGEGYWKLTVKDHYMPMVKKVVSQMEIDRPLMETLAVIAWKYPVLQADVIKIRHNKAYDHLKRLEELGFVNRIRYGRTNKLTLTSKFFEYFDLPSKEQAKDLFKGVMPEKTMEKIEKTEQEIDEAERKMDDLKRKKEEMEKEAKDKKDNIEKPSPHDPPAPNPIENSESVESSEPDQGKGSEPALSPEPAPGRDPVPLHEASEEGLKKELKEMQAEEDKEFKKIEKDTEELDKEEKKEFYD